MRESGTVSEKRLLILSCSQRKQSDPGRMPAVERYDGPFYRVLRKYVRTAPTPSTSPAPSTWVLSAEYGLIPSEQPITDYDRRMTLARAEALRPQVEATLDELATRGFTEAFVCAGRTYRVALADAGDRLECPLRYTSGSIGHHLAMLRDWLYGAPPKAPAGVQRGPIVFRGMSIAMTPEAVRCLARQRATEDPAGASRYAAWYVPVNELRVAPKWLLSELTGVPVSDFTTTAARRVLTALGVEVLRT